MSLDGNIKSIIRQFQEGEISQSAMEALVKMEIELSKKSADIINEDVWIAKLEAQLEAAKSDEEEEFVKDEITRHKISRHRLVGERDSGRRRISERLTRERSVMRKKRREQVAPKPKKKARKAKKKKSKKKAR